MVIDETLYSYQGRISLKHYNPSKPAKYGLLFRILYDSMVQFASASLPYAGKPTGTPDKYYVTGTHKNTEYLVSTAIELGRKGCERKKYFPWSLFHLNGDSGTVPGEEHQLQSPEPWSPIGTEYQRKWKNLLWKMVLYVNRNQWTGATVAKRSWFLMQMRRRLEKRLCWLWQKCLTWWTYRKTSGRNLILWSTKIMKGGVDVVDLVSIGASTRTKTKWRTLNANFSLLHTVRTNARTF